MIRDKNILNNIIGKTLINNKNNQMNTTADLSINKFFSTDNTAKFGGSL